MASFGYGGIIEQLASTVAANGTTTLTNTSKQIQILTTSGVNGQTYTLPDATTMLVGQKFEFYNTSGGTLTVNANGGSTLFTIPSGFSALAKLTVNGSSAGTWVNLPSSGGSTNIAPTVQKFTSTGTATGYLFTVSSANATAGATYTNNSQTFTVLSTISAGTQLFTSSAGAPTSTGTLTKSSGTGDATITFTANQAMATYTRPSGPAPIYLRVRLVGGGGGGGSNGAHGDGGTGTPTTFGSALLIGNGGVGGLSASTGQGGIGGTASLGTGPIGIAIPGGWGGALNNISNTSGASGASSPFGGESRGGSNALGENGLAPIANTGCGGGAGSGDGSNRGGAGGGAGGYVDAIITSPASTYYYSVGTGGVASTGGTFNGAAGSYGFIIVEEFYQ